MTKFAVLFVAALAFYGSIAGPSSSGRQQNQWIRGLLKQIEENSNEAATSIRNAQIDSNQAKRSLRSQANDWARRIETANFLLQRAINHDQAGEGQQILKQVADRLSLIASSLRQVLNAEPSELKNKLKTLIQDVASDADKLIDVLQLQLQKDKCEFNFSSNFQNVDLFVPTENQDNISEDLEDVLEELLGATRQLKLRRKLLSLNQQQIKDAIQQAAKDVPSAIESISSKDQKVARELAHQTHELSHHLSRIIHHLRREAHHLDDESKNTILQVSNKLSEIRASLDQAANSQGRNDAQAWINDLKNQLKTNISNAAAQLERLVQLMRTGNESSQDAQDINNLIRSILANSLSGARRLQWRLENIDENSDN